MTHRCPPRRGPPGQRPGRPPRRLRSTRRPTASGWGTRTGSSTRSSGHSSSSARARSPARRSSFQFSTSAFAGKKILGATLRTFETHSASCAARSVSVTRTGPISAATTWNNQPAVQLAAGSKSFANGHDSSCPDNYVEFPVTNSVVDTAAKGYTTSTFRLAATDETDEIAWKQFNSTGELQITYVTPPGVPGRLGLTDPQIGCQQPADMENVGSVNIQFGVTPRLTPIDSGARVKAEIEIFSSSGNLFRTYATGLDLPNTALTVTIPSKDLPDQVTYHFRARTLYPYSSAYGSGTLYSAYTIWCYFKVDRLAPPPPIVTAKYGTTNVPNCAAATTTCQEIVPHGAAISYTIKGAAADVVRHEYFYQGARVRSQVSGNTVTVNLVPSDTGYNLLHVVSFDAAGSSSKPTDFLVNLKSAAPPVAAWSFDDGSGTTAADTAAPSHPLTLTGGAAFDDAGRDGGSLQLDGADDYAQTATPVVDTSQSFTVSAWARLTSVKEAVVVGAAGNISSAFELYYSGSLNRWVFMRVKSDTMAPSNVKALSDEPAVLGAWTLVTGVYDAAPNKGRLRLYINGRLQSAGDVPYLDSAWKATGPLSIGHGQYNDVFGNRFAGSVDAVKIWQRPLNDKAVMAEVEIRKADRVVAGRAAVWPLNSATLDADQVWRTEDTIYGANLAISGFGGGADQSTAFVEDDDMGRVLQFSGAASESLTLPRAVVDGGTSFSAAVWVKLEDATKPAVIARQAGPDRDAWRLEWKPVNALSGQWIFSRTPANSTEPKTAVFEADIDAVTNYWQLIVGTYDASAEDAIGSALGEIGITVNKRADAEGRDSYIAPYRLGSTVIGKGRTAGAEFAGQLHDFRMYSGPLLDNAICDEFPELEGNCPVPAG
ncbi:LamG-like jellyroll fold domain-containing protein [Kribbella sp. NPDC051620]|uniref:LamG-like jellyroll fold domain-containing protein n=1 Tax=Kribbella sp. NPDC051620 TaxID=3364120 RepID=UPI00378A6EC4